MEDNESVEGMSYDWTSKTLYFVDGAKPAIEMVQVGHREVFYYKLCAASITFGIFIFFKSSVTQNFYIQYIRPLADRELKFYLFSWYLVKTFLSSF